MPYGDADALAGAVGERTAMVLLEPMLGEGGVLPAPAGYLGRRRVDRRRRRRAVRRSTRCRPASAAPAPGSRTRPTASQPDVITLAKALGGGLPIGACLAFGDAADAAAAGSHGSHLRRQPDRRCAAALAVLDTIRDEGLLERAKELEHRFTAGIDGLGHPLRQRRPRARAALLGVVLTAPTSPARSRRRCAPPASSSTRSRPDVAPARPPLVLTDAQVDAFVAALPGAPSTAADGDDLTQ